MINWMWMIPIALFAFMMGFAFLAILSCGSAADDAHEEYMNRRINPATTAKLEISERKQIK